KIRMERRLAFLGTLGSNAPFIGLLGTVIGIIRAFAELNDAAGKVTAGLMSEVGEALVATAIGIMVAIPPIAIFNAFHRIIKTRGARAEPLGREVLASLKSDRPAQGAPAACSPPPHPHTRRNAMAAAAHDSDEMITSINVTPLVDITLVLLIILMITASYVASKAIPLDLPKGATAEATPTTLSVSIDKDGKTFLDAAPID